MKFSLRTLFLIITCFAILTGYCSNYKLSFLVGYDTDGGMHSRSIEYLMQYKAVAKFGSKDWWHPEQQPGDCLAGGYNNNYMLTKDLNRPGYEKFSGISFLVGRIISLPVRIFR
jgi:hypothetical protein